MSAIDMVFKPRERILPIDIAIVCHEANRAYCESIGDYSQKSWVASPDWQRSSALNGVLAILKNPSAPPSASHENWLREKLESGWVYGPVKDPDAKTHPCCVAYDQLAPAQKIKDTLFHSIVHALMPMLEQAECSEKPRSTA